MGKRVKIDLSSTKAEDPPQPPTLRTASTSSMPNLLSSRNSTAAVPPLLPEPIPGPRRHTIIAPAEGIVVNTKPDGALDGSFTGIPEATRPFFISPFPPKSAKGAKGAVIKTKSLDLPVQAATFEKRETNTSGLSDSTEVELTHELRLAEQRRRREFPRRL